MRSRRAILCGGALLVLGGTGALAHPHHELKAEQIGDIERQLSRFRGRLKDAVAAKDVRALKGFYAESFTHTHASGQVDGKEARLATLLSGAPAIETAPVTELTVRVHGPDMAVLTGRSSFRGTDGRDEDVRWMQVCSRASGHWQLAASQATRLPATA